MFRRYKAKRAAKQGVDAFVAAVSDGPPQSHDGGHDSGTTASTRPYSMALPLSHLEQLREDDGVKLKKRFSGEILMSKHAGNARRDTDLRPAISQADATLLTVQRMSETEKMLRESLLKAKNEVVEQQTTMASLRENMRKAERRCSDAEARLKEERVDRTREVNSLKQQIESAETVVAASKVQMETDQRRYKKEIAGLREENRLLDSLMTQTQKDLKAEETKLLQAEKELVRREELVSKTQDEQSEFSHLLDNAHHKVETLTSQLEEARHYERECGQLRQRLIDMERDVDLAKQEAESARAEAKMAEAERAERTGREVDAQVQLLRQQKEDLSSQLNNALTKVKNLELEATTAEQCRATEFSDFRDQVEKERRAVLKAQENLASTQKALSTERLALEEMKTEKAILERKLERKDREMLEAARAAQVEHEAAMKSLVTAGRNVEEETAREIEKKAKEILALKEELAGVLEDVEKAALERGRLRDLVQDREAEIDQLKQHDQTDAAAQATLQYEIIQGTLAVERDKTMELTRSLVALEQDLKKEREHRSQVEERVGQLMRECDRLACANEGPVGKHGDSNLKAHPSASDGFAGRLAEAPRTGTDYNENIANMEKKVDELLQENNDLKTQIKEGKLGKNPGILRNKSVSFQNEEENSVEESIDDEVEVSQTSSQTDLTGPQSSWLQQREDSVNSSAEIDALKSELEKQRDKVREAEAEHRSQVEEFATKESTMLSQLEKLRRDLETEQGCARKSIQETETLQFEVSRCSNEHGPIIAALEGRVDAAEKKELEGRNALEEVRLELARVSADFEAETTRKCTLEKKVRSLEEEIEEVKRTVDEQREPPGFNSDIKYALSVLQDEQTRLAGYCEQIDWMRTRAARASESCTCDVRHTMKEFGTRAQKLEAAIRDRVQLLDTAVGRITFRLERAMNSSPVKKVPRGR